MSDIIKNDKEILFIDHKTIDDLILKAKKSSRHMARLLMHLSHENPVQEMLIALTRDCLVMPNQSVGKSESLQLIKGEMLLVIFSEDGKIKNSIRMGTPKTKLNFLYRLSNTPWHTMIPLSDIVIVHEVLQGPFEASSETSPDWLPQNNENLKLLITQVTKDSLNT